VATVAINNSTNAALLAARIIGTFMPSVHLAMDKYLEDLDSQVMSKVDKLAEVGWDEYKVVR
jgi:phosphoribosylaminoimidazole carboxylase